MTSFLIGRPAGAADAPVRASRSRKRWIPLALCAALWVVFFAYEIVDGGARFVLDSPAAWLAMATLHLPYLLILVLLAFGLLERIGVYWRGRHPPAAGRLPSEVPRVCVQLPMFNEHAVARRIIEAGAALRWPADRLTIQVLDDSTDADTRDMVREICAQVQARTGVTCTWIHRTDRTGYKAGALEAGRHLTDAEYIAIFDADFVPPPDFLERAVPHFYDASGTPVPGLALVQAQWGHLNDDESLLTEAQALWVDDHHSLQMSWRSANVDFVNFTGTAGIWRAAAIEAVGGWRSASLVEDCELSVRVLFAGYRTRFVRDIAVPAELPQTFAAYRLQQKRWTQGWAQLQRLHLGTLLFRYRTHWARKAYLTYLICISWQWPLWALWIAVFPFLIASGLWLGAFGAGVALAAYLLPPLAFALFAAVAATRETRHGRGASRIGFARRCARVFPYLVVNTGMLPHHVCAFVEGLFGPMHAEFERTPKTASVTAVASGSAPTAPERPRRDDRRSLVRRRYLYAEAMFLAAQVAWIVLFVSDRLPLAALGAAWLALCVGGIRMAPLVAEAVRHRAHLGLVGE